MRFLTEDPVKHDLVVSPFVLGFHPQVKIERGAWEYALDFLEAFLSDPFYVLSAFSDYYSFLSISFCDDEGSDPHTLFFCIVFNVSNLNIYDMGKFICKQVYCLLSYDFGNAELKILISIAVRGIQKISVWCKAEDFYEYFINAPVFLSAGLENCGRLQLMSEIEFSFFYLFGSEYVAFVDDCDYRDFDF